MGFLPDEWKGGPKTDRTFFFQIWVFLECAMVEEIISDVRKQRFLQLRVHEPRPIVDIQSDWAQALLNVPKRPCKFSSI
jgi:hypothetical protein